MSKCKKYNIRGFFEVEQEDGSWVKIFDGDPANIPTTLNIIFEEAIVQIQIKQIEDRDEINSFGEVHGSMIGKHGKK